MRRWVILGVLVALLLAVAWWFFFISPRNARIAQAGDDLQAAQDQEMALRAQVDQLHAIRDSEVEYLAGIGQLETLIPERPLLDEFIEDIYALCGTTGVELLNLAPAMPVPCDRVVAAPDHGGGHHRRRVLRGARVPVRRHGHGPPGAGGRHRASRRGRTRPGPPPSR